MLALAWPAPGELSFRRLGSGGGLLGFAVLKTVANLASSCQHFRQKCVMCMSFPYGNVPEVVYREAMVRPALGYSDRPPLHLKGNGSSTLAGEGTI